MSRWVYWVSLMAIATVLFAPAWHMLTDPQADIRDLFRLGIDLEGGTSLIYELHAPEGGGEAPDAKAAKTVIMGRIDPQGTRGYTVRAVGAHRLEIVLPGRATKVRITQEATTQEALAAAREAAVKQQNRPAADLLQEKAEAFAAGTRLAVRMAPALYLDDIQSRVAQTVAERMPTQRGMVAVVGLKQAADQWEEVQVLLAVPPTDTKRLSDWKELITTALATQRDVSRVKRLVRQAGFLEFRIVADKVKDKDKADFERTIRLKQAGQPAPQGWRWYPLKKGWDWYKQGLLDAWNFVYVVDKDTQTVEALVNVADGQDVSGRDMSHASASVANGEPVVQFSMKSTAGTRFATLTKPENKNRQMAIILDGVIQSAPSLRATLSTGGIIEGYKNRRELEEVVTVLNSGQLAASLGDPVTERTVGPELGEDNIYKGTVASLVGFGLVVCFMAGYYLFAGAVADVALLLNLALTVCIMFVIRQTWTLPGIAGLILSLAMAVDANVLIYERLREEKGKEGSLSFALKKAYERAFTTIFDSNLTTVIPAFVLLMPGLATEEVKGFAVVMIIGLGVSMFTAIVVTRMIFETGIRMGWVKEIRMFHLFSKPNIDWMRFGRWAFVISTSLGLLGILAFFIRGQDKYDIEFVGGTQVELALKPPKDMPSNKLTEMVRERANAALGGAATVQELEYANANPESGIKRFLISVASVGGEVSGEQAVKAALAKAFENMRPEGGGEKVTAGVSEITDQVVRETMAGTGPPKPAAAVAPEAPKPAAATTEAPAAQFIPPELRQYIGKVRVVAEIAPPMPLGEVQRRIDNLIRDRYPEMVGTLYKVEGKVPAAASGEFKSFELWVRDDFLGKHAETPNPAFWTEVVRGSLAQEETFASTTSFEPTMAGEAWDKAVIAIIFSLAAMVAYIWLRFAKFSSGIAAVVATLHDVLITLGAVTVAVYLSDTFLGTALMLTDMKVNLPLIGAFLTLVGYSVNDTIVVFDRIRENRGKYGDLSITIINNSINQTLSRTVLTSSTVFVAVVALYFFGGKTSSIHGLAFVMLFGTVVGCYSSIAVASPILVLQAYMRKVYAWAYPILGLGVLVYYVFVWSSPAALAGSPVGIVAVLLALAWLAVSAWACWCDAHDQPWTLGEKSPVLVKVLAATSVLAPLAAVGFFAGVMLASRTSHATAWAGPASFAGLLACGTTYSLFRLMKRRVPEKVNPAG